MPWKTEPCSPQSPGQPFAILGCHDEVIDGNDDDFDKRYLPTTPVGLEHQYGYCAACGQPFRWDVARQRWMETTVEQVAEDAEFHHLLQIRDLSEIRDALQG